MNAYQYINRQLRAAVPHTKLLKGRGYIYLVYDDGTNFDTRSIAWYSPDTDSTSVAYIIEEARELAASTCKH